MSNSEKFTRAMLTIRSAFGTPAAWEFWAGMGREQMEKALASGDAKKVETTLQSMFVGQWSAAAGQARTNKAKVAAKKDSYKVRGWYVVFFCVCGCACVCLCRMYACACVPA